MTSIDDVTDTSPRVQYTAVAAQVAFTYSFPLFNNTDIVVDVDGVTKTLTTDYTVSGVGNDTGGTVTFVTAPGAGAVVTLYRDTAIERLTDFQQNGPFSSTAHNDELDKLVTILLELENKIGRCIRFPLTGAITNAGAELSPISTYAGKFLRVTSAGLLEAAQVTDSVVTLSAEVIGALINPQTTAESSAGVTPTAYRYVTGNPFRYGAVGDGVTDDAAAFQAAVDVADAGGPFTIKVPAGTYALGSVIEPATELFGLIFEGDGSLNTKLQGTHSDGPVIKFNRSNSGVRGISVTASAGHTAGGATPSGGTWASNVGILFEPADTAGKTVSNCILEDARVIDQPSHGIVSIGTSIETRWSNALVQDNLGHGAVFDIGTLTSRTNKANPGIVTLENFWALDNAGHGLVVGNPSDASTIGGYRFFLLNAEFDGNATDASVRHTADNVWLRGENITIDSPAFGGDSARGGVSWGGRDLIIRNPRFIGCTRSVNVREDEVASTSRGLRVIAPRFVTTAQNPAIVIDDITTCYDFYVRSSNAGNVTQMFTAGALKAVWDNADPVVVARSTSDTTINNSTTLVDVDGLSVYLEQNETVNFEAHIRYSGDASADIKFAVVGPSGTTVRWAAVGSAHVGAGDTYGVDSTEVTESGTRTFGSAATVRVASIVGYAVIGGTAGELKIQAAQASAVSADTDALTNSFLRVLRANANL